MRGHGFWHRIVRHPLAVAGGCIVVGLILVAILAPVISAHAITHGNPQAIPRGGLGQLGEPHAPGGGFLWGADSLGRDVFTRTLFGARISLIVAFCAMATTILIGGFIGLWGGYFGGWQDATLSRLTETVLSLPTILLALALFKVIPGETAQLNFMKLLLAITLVTWTGIARAVRGQVLSLKEQEFIEAARAIGCSHARIIFVHLLPNVLPTVIVLATLAVANNILLEAGLSYLGVGIDPGVASWGGMIRDGQPYMTFAPWIILAPGAAIVTAVAGFNMLGQALQETLEPRRP